MTRFRAVTVAAGLLLALPLLAAACQGDPGVVAPADEPAIEGTAATAPISGTGATGLDAGTGMDRGHAAMMRMHQQPVPAEYKGRQSPTEPDEAGLARGRTVYDTYCALCHGATGQGDGPAAATMDPPPAPVAMSSTHMGDDYLYWRVSEGGAHFDTGMPVWKAALSEPERWDVIHYMRSLGNAPAAEGAVTNAQAAMDRMHDAMLAEGRSKGVISAEDVALFRRVHPFIDQFNTHESAMMAAAGSEKKSRQREFAAKAVAAGLISQADADAFTRVHDALIDAGIMP